MQGAAPIKGSDTGDSSDALSFSLRFLMRAIKDDNIVYMSAK